MRDESQVCEPCGIAGDLLAGEVFQEDGQGWAGRINRSCEFKQHSGIFICDKQVDDQFAGALDFALRSLVQALAMLVVRKDRHARRQGFGEENIPGARFSQGAAQGLPCLAVSGYKFGRRYRGEELDDRAQAAEGDAGLVHEFRVLAGEQALFVALEVLEAVEGDAAEGFVRRNVGIDCCWPRLHGF